MIKLQSLEMKNGRKQTPSYNTKHEPKELAVLFQDNVRTLTFKCKMLLIIWGAIEFISLLIAKDINVKLN